MPEARVEQDVPVEEVQCQMKDWKGLVQYDFQKQSAYHKALAAFFRVLLYYGYGRETRSGPRRNLAEPPWHCDGLPDEKCSYHPSIAHFYHLP